MNLIEVIAGHIAAGLSAAESAAKLELEHAVQVSEDWVRKIMGADGFSAALASAQARVSAAAGGLGADIAEAAKAEATMVGESQQASEPAPGPGAAVMEELTQEAAGDVKDGSSQMSDGAGAGE